MLNLFSNVIMARKKSGGEKESMVTLDSGEKVNLSDPNVEKKLDALLKKNDQEVDKIIRLRKNVRRISIGAMIFCIFAVLLVIFFFSLTPNLDGEDKVKTGNFLTDLFSKAKMDTSSLAAKVDGKYITTDEVISWLQFINTQRGNKITSKTDVLEQLIVYELLLKDAKRNRIFVSDDKVNDAFAGYETVTKGQISEVLRAQNLTEEEFKDHLKNTLIINELFNSKIKEPTISDDDINNFKAENTDFISLKTQGQNYTDDFIDNSIRLTLIDLKKKELEKEYVDNLLDNSKIKYYNEYEILME